MRYIRSTLAVMSTCGRSAENMVDIWDMNGLIILLKRQFLFLCNQSVSFYVFAAVHADLEPTIVRS
jgi:hypothetical protein